MVASMVPWGKIASPVYVLPSSETKRTKRCALTTRGNRRSNGENHILAACMRTISFLPYFYIQCSGKADSAPSVPANSARDAAYQIPSIQSQPCPEAADLYTTKATLKAAGPWIHSPQLGWPSIVGQVVILLVNYTHGFKLRIATVRGTSSVSIEFPTGISLHLSEAFPIPWIRKTN
jgi:hypothetical protein